MKKKNLKMFASILLVNCILLSGCSDINSATAENSSEVTTEYAATVNNKIAKNETDVSTAGLTIAEILETTAAVPITAEVNPAAANTETITEAVPLAPNDSNQQGQATPVVPEVNENPIPEEPAPEQPEVPAPVYKLGDMTNYLTQIYGSEENFKAQYYAALNQIRASYGNSALRTSWILEDRALKVAQICGDRRQAGHPAFPSTPEMKGYGTSVESVILMPVKDLTETSIYDFVYKMTVKHTEQTVSDGNQFYCGINIYYFTVAESLYCTITLDTTTQFGMSLLTKTEEQYVSGMSKGVFYEYYFTSQYAGKTP